MELTYNELRKRDVINIADGSCLGRITDLRISFPKGIMTGIYVPGRRGYFIRFFDRKQIYIDRSRIIKIGGDVILVNINCADVCMPNENTVPREKKCPTPPHCPPKPPCGINGRNDSVDFSVLSGGVTIDDGDY